MSSYKSIERITFLSRQLSDIADDGNELSALAKLKSACPEHYAGEIADLERMLGDQADDGQFPRQHPYSALARLLREVPGRKLTLLRGFIDYIRQSRTVLDAYWAGVVGVFSYLATLAAVMMVISLIFGIWTIPSFQQMFDEFGAELPALTATVFKFGGAGFPTIAVLTMVIVLFVAWFATTTIRRMKRLEPLPAWSSAMPLFGKPSRYYNQGLMLNIARLLMDSGVSQDDAVRIAARETNQADTLPTDLAVAAKLGNLKNEISYECEEHLGTLSLALVDARDQFALFLKVAIYSLVAVLVIAMYLPIFKLGSVI